jgi:Fe2+ transport system protein FeoA
VPGFTAVAGFDVASGWGTVSAPVFVPALVAADKRAHNESAARAHARSELARLGKALTVTPARIGRGATARLVSAGFLPGHPVRIYVDGRRIATRHASAAGTISYVIIPARLGLTAGRHAVTLTSMLLDEHGGFVSH